MIANVMPGRLDLPVWCSSSAPVSNRSSRRESAASRCGQVMDVFEAVHSRIACGWFLDKPVDPDIVRSLIAGASRAASNGNLQPWNVYAVTGEPLKEIKRQAANAIEKQDWRTFETEYRSLTEKVWEPYSR